MLMVGWYNADHVGFRPKLEFIKWFGCPRTNEELEGLRKELKRLYPWSVPEIYSIKEIGD